MSMIVRPVPDTELHRACTIEDAASADIDLNRILFPGPFPPDSHQQRVDQLVQLRKDDHTAVYLQAIDTASGRMVAFARWHIFKTPDETQIPIRKLKLELESNSDMKKLESNPGTNFEACKVFLSRMVERKQAILGTRPHIYLHMLHTDPEHQGCGAGSALMESIKQNSYELGLPIYLESSTKAHKFYENHGFKDVEVADIDFRPLGGPVYQQPLMIREISKPH